jgi:phenylalanyl-tRNA synthetase beta chain
MRVDKTNGFLGTDMSRDAMGAHLRSLEMDVRETGENELMVTPPSFRVDISREVDLMEEVARIDGYDKIPVTYPSIRPSEEGVSAILRLGEQVKEIMVGLGFSEVITYGFISPDSADILGADEGSPLRSFVRLVNPLTSDQSVMRTSLIPGLMATVKTNFLHDQKDLKVFEWGKVFIQKQGEELPLEKPFLAAILTGAHHPKTWYNKERPVDFYDIKGAVESILRALGIEGVVFHKESKLPGYDSAISSSILFNDTFLGRVGRVSKGAVEAYGLAGEDAYVFELDGEALLGHLSGVKKFQPFTKYPAVYRDISVIVGRHTESAKLTEIIKQTGGEWVESVHIFDLYEGEKMEPSEKALAFNLCFRSRERTLGGEEVNRLYESIIDRIRQETGGRLREG